MQRSRFRRGETTGSRAGSLVPPDYRDNPIISYRTVDGYIDFSRPVRVQPSQSSFIPLAPRYPVSIPGKDGTRIGVTQALICRSLSFFDLDTFTGWPSRARSANDMEQLLAASVSVASPGLFAGHGQNETVNYEARRAGIAGIDYERVDLIGFLSKLIRFAIQAGRRLDTRRYAR